MSSSPRQGKIFRWILSVLLVTMGLSTVWAWGRVAQLAEPQPAEAQPVAQVLYAAWQSEDSGPLALFRSDDEGATWQHVTLPEGRSPAIWAGDAGEAVAVVLDDGSLVRSADRGETWQVVISDLPVLSVAWGADGILYAGTDGYGLYRHTADGTLSALASSQSELATSPVEQVAFVDGRLFAATPTVLFHADVASGAGEETWTKSLPMPNRASALVAVDREMVFIGTETEGVYKSDDAGRTWQSASAGLGLTAGQMARVTALRADPAEPGVLYVALDYLVGATSVHASAAGAFVTLDGAGSWQPLDGPTFPNAEHALGLVVVPDRPLYAEAVTAQGLQRYGPDVVGALAALEEGDAAARASAARLLGLARASEAGDLLLAALADPEPAVSLAASEALGRIGDPEMAGGLLLALENPSQQVRLGAARALGMMGAPGAVEPLRAMLLNGDAQTVPVAAEALGRIGSPAATDALLATLADPKMTARRHAALSALEEMGEPAVASLVAVLDSPNGYARRNAAQALGWIGSTAATSALVDVLEDNSPGVRQEAAWALGEIGDPAAQDALARVQRRDPSAAVQAEAGLALAQLETSAASAPSWMAALASTLNEFQALRWLVLGLSLAGAAWLVLGNPQRTAAPVFNR